MSRMSSLSTSCLTQQLPGFLTDSSTQRDSQKPSATGFVLQPSPHLGANIHGHCCSSPCCLCLPWLCPLSYSMASWWLSLGVKHCPTFWKSYMWSWFLSQGSSWSFSYKRLEEHPLSCFLFLKLLPKVLDCELSHTQHNNKTKVKYLNHKW
jgi:hypothetical protein